MVVYVRAKKYEKLHGSRQKSIQRISEDENDRQKLSNI